MAFIFFDASALVKRYVPETGDAAVHRAIESGEPHSIATSWLSILEVISVLSRKKNDRRISVREHSQAARAFELEVVESTHFLVMLPEAMDYIAALSLVTRHNINASDALILECARRWFAEVGAGEFWTSDRRLVRAARAEGILVVDPADPPPDLPPEAPRPSPSEI